MFTRIAFFGTIIIASIAYLLSGSNSQQRVPYVQGKNKTVLFLTNKEHGLVNVHVATASALRQNWPDIDIHYGSFAGLQDKLEKANSFSTAKTRDITFHELRGLSFLDCTIKYGKTQENMIHPPAPAGFAEVMADMQFWIDPWEPDDHVAVYEELTALIDEVDPAVVVLDTFFRPAIDAARDKNRLHVFVTPNSLVDNFLRLQPYSKMLWKWPAFGSGFGFPVPLSKIPENIYLNARYIYTILKGPIIAPKRAELQKRGFKADLDFLGLPGPDVPWITVDIEGASVPMDVLHPNVTIAGPIFISSAPASEQDPELAAWLERAPTVLVNLGSLIVYDEIRASAMAIALAVVLSNTEVQVLWKFNKADNYNDDFFAPLETFYAQGRLRLTNWLTADPFSLLDTGNIAVSINHGGSNSYQEAVAAGVAQVALPLWTDHYNYAALVEDIGVGVWGCRSTAPDWTASALSEAILKAVKDGSVREKAKRLGEKVRAGEKGCDIAARAVAKLAYL